MHAFHRSVGNGRLSRGVPLIGILNAVLLVGPRSRIQCPSAVLEASE